MAEASATGTVPGRAVRELQEMLLGQAFEYGPVAAIVLDEHGNFLAANERATQICGYPREVLLDLGCAGLDADGVRDERLEAMAAGKLTSGTAKLRCGDGTEKEVDFRVGETKVGGLPFYLGVFWEPS